MANYIRIISVLILFCVGLYIINYAGNIITNKKIYTPIYNTPIPIITKEKSNNLVIQIIDNKIEEIPIVTIKPDITIKPIIITPVPLTVNNPVARVTPLKLQDYNRVLSCFNGFKAYELAFNPSNYDFGSDYYYGGDYAVFKVELINTGNREIKNPTAKIFADNGLINVQVFTKKLDLDLKPSENKVLYFDFSIPNYTGFYKITVNLYDDNNVLLLTFYKEINIL